MRRFSAFLNVQSPAILGRRVRTRRRRRSLRRRMLVWQPLLMRRPMRRTRTKSRADYAETLSFVWIRGVEKGMLE